jgi:putative transcriptional regulator
MIAQAVYRHRFTSQHPSARRGWHALLAAAATAVTTAIVVALGLGASAVQAQELGDGVLLVAGPDVADPNFAHSVVLVLQHGENGTIGVVLNRVTSIVPAKVFPELETALGAYTGTLFRGGPVGPTRLVSLVRGLAAATVQGPEIVDKVFLSGNPDSLGDVTRLAKGPDELRMYAGHAEWTAGQLEGEIRNGGWHIVAATSELVFADPRTLWDQLAKRGDEVVVDAR